MPVQPITRRSLATCIIVFAAMYAASNRQALAADPVPAGEGSFEFSPAADRPQQKLKVWTYRPEGFRPDSPIVIVMHGVKRDGKGYRDHWAPHSRKGDFLLLVPEFPEAEYP